MIEVKHNLPKLQAALREYQRLTGKSMGDILANEGKWFAIGLNQEFKRISPRPASILAQAQSRRFAMGRRGDRIAPAVRGISAAAWRRADNLLEGAKSDTFKVSQNDGMLLVRRARFSSRRGNRLLRGGRYGNRFSSSAIKASQIEREMLVRQRRDNPDLKLLNRRALATAIEISLRSRAAKGGLMAVQWLPQVYKSRKSAVVKRGPLVVRSTRQVPLGRVDFRNGVDGEVRQVALTAMVPGTEKQAQKHGIPERVEASRVADRMEYINRKVQQNAKLAFR